MGGCIEKRTAYVRAERWAEAAAAYEDADDWRHALVLARKGGALAQEAAMARRLTSRQSCEFLSVILPLTVSGRASAAVRWWMDAVQPSCVSWAVQVRRRRCC